MAQVINIQDAKLKTLSVEIKALTVNGKQMTLSVFRQLPEANIFDGEGRLRGTAWGFVRHRWGDMPDGAIHVVWQRGESLCRFATYEWDWKHTGKKLPQLFIAV